MELTGWAESMWIGGILSGVAVVIGAGNREGLDHRAAYWACTCALLGAFIGASLLGLYDYGEAGASWNPLARGKSFCGGLIGGALAAAVYLLARRQSVARYGDVLVTGLALGYAIGRIGCFFNGCDFGVRTDLPWGIHYPPGTEPYADHLVRGWIQPEAASSLTVHPVQLYAALCGALIFCVLVRAKPTMPGLRLVQFALLYGVYRFPMELLRGDFKPFLGPLSVPQVVSLALLVAGAAGWWGLRSSRRYWLLTGSSQRVADAINGKLG